MLGWVRLVIRYKKNTHMPQLLQRFRSVRPMWEFPAICSETRYGNSDAREAGHSWGNDLGHLQPKKHLYTCDMASPSFRWGSDAPEHLSGETLDPQEITLDFPSTAGTGIKRG